MAAEINRLISNGVSQVSLRENQNREVPSVGKEGKSFMDHLVSSLKDVNNLENNADLMAQDVATGKSENLHETMLAITQAELSFNLMVQVRNKALEAYQEIMRMPV